MQSASFYDRYSQPPQPLVQIMSMSPVRSSEIANFPVKSIDYDLSKSLKLTRKFKGFPRKRVASEGLNGTTIHREKKKDLSIGNLRDSPFKYPSEELSIMLSPLSLKRSSFKVTDFKRVAKSLTPSLKNYHSRQGLDVGSFRVPGLNQEIPPYAHVIKERPVPTQVKLPRIKVNGRSVGGEY
mmetsp:Transcript_29926/g.53129  ORF Transcript_29926/g.53129 Transcript_29926/m.53129 type:complete len:182 (+) Transcript_29926:83-628(+)|eukprot:CAMPEP_0204911094 /NCGR_PEP_ID=MMETSP1397-20131031/9501_1 /ASSEMBLY_ACC=CAM_ASM_000891 /TAXON_ID=49980 /ORGANISM="Climacostomum Climacostomum virens, Strain Stock W-24" /LENGTH=181 /DNA_ID=CAMNT_0052081519 /DNA_START=60 /DNA_END=605 /DNA_ORIENTATION=-